MGEIHGLNIQTIITCMIRDNMHDKSNTQINIDISAWNVLFKIKNVIHRKYILADIDIFCALSVRLYY